MRPGQRSCTDREFFCLEINLASWGGDCKFLYLLALASSFSFDGRSHSIRCTVDDRNRKKDACGDSVVIDLGPHTVRITACSRSDCSLALGKGWYFEFRLTIGRRERVAIDIPKVAEAERKNINFLTAVARLPFEGDKQSPCVDAIEEGLYADTCRAKGFSILKTSIHKAHDICSKSWTDQTDLLLQYVVWTAIEVHPRQCYTAGEIQKLLGFLVDWYIEDSFWPPGTVDKNRSSWNWARRSAGENTFSTQSGKTFRKEIFRDLDRARKRQAVVDDLIAKSLALKSKKVEGLQQVHCGLSPEVDNLLASFIADKNLSPTEWQAVHEMLGRTPNDKSLKPCSVAMGTNVSSSIPLRKRLLTLEKKDCGTARSTSVRGSTISILADSKYNLLTAEDRLWLLEAFPDCISF